MKKQNIKFKYIFEDDYNPKYVNGAQGGINPKGEIIINFYVERAALPKSVTHSLEDNKLSRDTVTEPEDLKDSLVRYVQNGIILDIRSAKEIYNWLGRHIDEYENMIQNDED
jgi:hypothetical protein